MIDGRNIPLDGGRARHAPVKRTLICAPPPPNARMRSQSIVGDGSQRTLPPHPPTQTLHGGLGLRPPEAQGARQWASSLPPPPSPGSI